jgi:putative transposase
LTHLGICKAARPTDLWCADYTGTITDFTRRYLISCDALATTREMYAFTVFERVFKDHWFALAIRTNVKCPSPAPLRSLG